MRPWFRRERPPESETREVDEYGARKPTAQDGVLYKYLYDTLKSAHFRSILGRKPGETPDTGDHSGSLRRGVS